MVPGTGVEVLQDAAPRHVDHCYPAFGRVAAVVADPQPKLVRLQGHAQRLVTGIQVGHAGEGLGIDHRDLAPLWYRHENLLVIADGRPVHGPAWQLDAGHGAGHAPHRHRRVDHGEAGVIVQHQQEVAVQVEQRPGPDAALEKQRHPRLAALLAVPRRGRLHRVDPRPRGHARQRLTTGLVAELEADIGEIALLQFPSGQWPGLELHGHAVPAEPVQGLRIGPFLQQLARVAP